MSRGMHLYGILPYSKLIRVAPVAGRITTMGTINAPKPEARQERIEARLTAEQKEIIARAAALEGMSTSSFVVQRAVASATETLERHELLRLSASDSRRIADALLDPPEPTPDLVAAIARYRTATSR